MKRLYYWFFILLILNGSFVFAQQPTKQQLKQSETKNLVDSQTYIFHAQQLASLGGTNRQLTTDYVMVVLPDSINADLPYFGRAFTAPINPSDAGIKVATKNFNYQKAIWKKNGWQITIKPERTDVQQMFMTISNDGYATLQVNSNSRQPISYYGYISRN